MKPTISIRRKNPGWGQKLAAAMGKAKRKEIAVGYPQGRAVAYPDGRSLIEVAARHVFGDGVPQRDFMTYANTLMADDDVIKRLFKRMAKENTSPKPRRAVIDSLMEAAGLRAADLIRLAILEGDWEPNAPGTLHPSVGGTNPSGKKSTRPLIDTSHMKNNATYVVRDRT